jgi:hypothetical protein
MTAGLLALCAASVLACSEGGSAATGPATVKREKLPLTGKTADGQRWRLEASKADKDEDVGTSWCFQLRYTKDIVLDGNPFVGGVKTCGPKPAPRVSGFVAIDCARHSVFVFGGTRSSVTGLALRTHRGKVTKASSAVLPPGSQFTGSTFMVVGDTRDLPTRIEASGAGQRVLERIPGRATVCKPSPGAPEGGEPYVDFQSRK